MEEHTIIDGDILETTFEEFGTEFDRFNYVVVCNLEGEFFRAVPYIYARNITRVRTSLRIVSLDTHPKLREYAVRDELAQLCSPNPSLLCDLIDKQDVIIPNLHEEMRALQQLDALDHNAARSLVARLIAFMRSIRVGDTTGDGIFWLPEKYMEDVNESDDEATNAPLYEEQVRLKICAHIKYRPLPMARLMPISPERATMFLDLLQELDPSARADLFGLAQVTHFAPIFRNLSKLGPNGLKTLMAEEFRCVKNDEVVDNTALFIFNSEQLDTLTARMVPTADARVNLRYYVGDYLDELDLSRSFSPGRLLLLR